LTHQALVAISPKYAVAQVIGYIKGKSVTHIARTYMEVKRSFVGQHFWARGYFVSTVGADEEVFRQYIRHQEEQDKRLEQMSLLQPPPATFRGPTAFRRKPATNRRLRRLTTESPRLCRGDSWSRRQVVRSRPRFFAEASVRAVTLGR